LHQGDRRLEWETASEREDIGIFTLSFIDLAIPVSGIPITVTRTYDSRIKSRRDFGVGWKLDVAAGVYESNRAPGDGWAISESPPPFAFPCQEVGETKHHVTTVRLSDREFYSFTLALSNMGADEGGCFATATFVQTDGIASGATLVSLDGEDVFEFSGSDQLLDGNDFLLYNPRHVELTTPDGRRIDLDRTRGITAMRDLNGNTLTIGTNGIVSSTGKSVTFTRDGQGRITLITDPMSRTLAYRYDAAGDLVAFTDQARNTTTFTYDRQHDLIEINDPLGSRAVRSQYDAEGRLISTIDAKGRSTTLTHDVDARTETIQDRRGNVTILQYDQAGNVISKIDALGQHWAYTYDSRGNQLTATDPLNRVTTTTYDAMNNVLSFTSVDGDTTTFTRDAQGRVLTSDDARGRHVANTYDSHGNLLTRVDNSPATSSYSYDGAGNVLTATDPLDHMTHYAYDSSGNQTSVTDPLGHVTSSTYDALNRRITSTRTRTLPGGTAETLTTRFGYNALGKPTTTTDPYSRTTTIAYDAIGKPTSVTAKNDAVTLYSHDDAGLVSRIDYADGSFESFTYDENGNTLSETDRGGEVTTYRYDALNRRTRATHSDGSYTETTYDAVGRIHTTRDENGNLTTHAYAAHQETITDALNHVTVKDLNADGSTIQLTDARNNVTSFTYDLGVAGHGEGRLVRVDLPGGAYTAVGYDAEGRKTSERDADGHTTSFGYDAANRLISVTDPLSHVTQYAYDEVGNRRTITDANGHVTSFEYDRLGRKTARVLPLGERETFEYDATGNMTAHVDFNGARTTYTFDQQNRMIARTFPGQATDFFTYSPRGERLTAGPESFTYDQRGRMLSNTKATGEVIAYAVDAVGNRTSLTDPHGTTNYVFDALNRASAIEDPEHGQYGYGYDEVGNVTSIALANGVVTTRTYDALNHLTSITSRNAANTVLAAYTYSPSPAGHQAGVSETHLGRVVAWGYDDAGRLTSEAITDPTNGNRTITYAYDAVGNRSSRVDSVAGTTSYVYDNDDRLTSETSPSGTTAYSYDSNGNLTLRVGPAGSWTFAYDARNLQTQAETGANVSTYEYDVDGARTASGLNGVRTNFLVDRNLENPQVLRETNAPGVEIAHHVFGRGEILSSVRSSQGVRHMLYDAQRSVRQLTNATGAIADGYVFDSFGTALSRTGADANEFRYSGEQLEDETGLLYLRARRYDSTTGRFTGLDPFFGDPWKPRSLHRYAYAGSDPITERDPSGRDFSLGEVMVSVAVVAILVSIPNSTSVEGYKRSAEIKDGEAHAKELLRYVGANLDEGKYSAIFEAPVGRDSLTSVRYLGTVAANFRAMERLLDHVDYQPGEAGRCAVQVELGSTEAFAYTQSDRPSTIFVCDPYFHGHAAGNRSRILVATTDSTPGSIIVHELAHLVGANYRPEAYSTADMSTLSETPNLSILNAQHYEREALYLADRADPLFND
jgi:RHS repeat-associated protein